MLPRWHDRRAGPVLGGSFRRAASNSALPLVNRERPFRQGDRFGLTRLSGGAGRGRM